jgi:hypothetical protein
MVGYMVIMGIIMLTIMGLPFLIGVVRFFPILLGF